MDIIIAKHAEERIRTYRLSKDDVKDAIEHPIFVVDGYGGRLIAHKHLNDYILRVIYEEYRGRAIVITVYPTKKGRYEGKR